MASFILKGLVTNDGIDRLKMASTVYENGIDRLRKGNQRRRSGVMVSAPDSGESSLDSSPGRGHCVLFLCKTLYSHGASLHPGV